MIANNNNRAYFFAAASIWAMRKENLDVLLEIAARSKEQSAEAIQALTNQKGETPEYSYRVEVRDGVAIVPLQGPLFRKANLMTAYSGATSYQLAARDFQNALNDSNVRAICLEIDSPGGEVNGCHEFAAQIFAARGIKPVVAYVGGMACSAAYWLASAADEIVIDPTAQLGSIGVVSTYYDVKGAQKQLGVKEYVFRSSQSPRKNLPPDTKEGADALQVTLDNLAQVFIDRVAEYRGVKAEAVLNDFGQGGLLVGQAALDAGLADRFLSQEELLAELSGGISQPTYVLGAIENNPAASEVKVMDKKKKADEEAEETPEEICPDCGKDPCECKKEEGKAMSKENTEQQAASLEARLAAAEKQAAENKAAAEAAQKEAETANARAAALESEAQLQRFTQTAQNFMGDTAAHVGFMETLAAKCGEDSKELAFYVQQQTAHAQQVRASNLFKEAGRSGAGTPATNTAAEAVALQVKTLMDKNPDLSQTEAERRVMADNPKLYEAYRAEVSVKV